MYTKIESLYTTKPFWVDKPISLHVYFKIRATLYFGVE